MKDHDRNPHHPSAAPGLSAALVVGLCGSLFVGLALAACTTPAKELTPDQLITEGVMRCGQKNTPTPVINSNADGINLHRQVLSTDYDRIVNTLRTPAGWTAVERRVKRALEPIEKFCTLEIAVRLDPAKARVLYAEIEKNDDLGMYILRDEYMKEALKPYLPANKQ